MQCNNVTLYSGSLCEDRLAFLSSWMSLISQAFAPDDIFGRDRRVLVFTMVVSLICAVAFGLISALRSARVQVASNLKDETQPAGHRKSRLRSMLITGQIATCAVLLVGASLCVRSLQNASSIDPGFTTQHGIAATLTPS